MGRPTGAVKEGSRERGRGKGQGPGGRTTFAGSRSPCHTR